MQNTFDHAGNSHVHWLVYSDALFDSAAAIRKKLLIFKRRLVPRRRVQDEGYYDSNAHVFLLLTGLAIECLLKAKWLLDDGALTENGRYVGIRGAGDHNLRQIAYQCQRRFREKQNQWQARKCHFPSDAEREHIYSDRRQLLFSERQLFLLDQLSAYITWAGRYPVPKTAEMFSSRNGKAGIVRTISVRDIQDIDGLIKMIKRTMAAVDWRQLKNGDWVAVFPSD